jgi:hypothetical protein
VKHHVLLYTFHATRFLTNAEGCTRLRTAEAMAPNLALVLSCSSHCGRALILILARVGLATLS